MATQQVNVDHFDQPSSISMSAGGTGTTDHVRVVFVQDDTKANENIADIVDALQRFIDRVIEVGKDGLT